MNPDWAVSQLRHDGEWAVIHRLPFRIALSDARSMVSRGSVVAIHPDTWSGDPLVIAARQPAQVTA